MTEFYVSVAKVEDSGEYPVENMMRRIVDSLLYVYNYRLTVKKIGENGTTIKVTYLDADEPST